MNRHFHTVPTVLEGDSLYEAFCRLKGYCEELAEEIGDFEETITDKIDELEDDVDSKVSKGGDTMSGTLNMNGNNVSNVGGITGVNASLDVNADIDMGGDYTIKNINMVDAQPSWAVNKNYVDNHHDANKLDVDGGTMNGNIDMDGNGLGNVSQFYGDSAISVLVDLDMSGSTILGVAEPEEDDEVANKGYVDDQIASAITENYVKADGSVAMTNDLKISGGIQSEGKYFGYNPTQSKFYFGTQGTIDFSAGDIQVGDIECNDIISHSNIECSDIEASDITCGKIIANDDINCKGNKITNVSSINVNNIGANTLTDVIMLNHLDMHNHDIEGATSVTTGSVATDYLEAKTSNLDVTLSSNIDADGHRIVGLPSPNNNDDAVNKQYVDSKCKVYRGTYDGTDVDMDDDFTYNNVRTLTSNSNSMQFIYLSDLSTGGYITFTYGGWSASEGKCVFYSFITGSLMKLTISYDNTIVIS